MVGRPGRTEIYSGEGYTVKFVPLTISLCKAKVEKEIAEKKRTLSSIINEALIMWANSRK